MKKFIFISTILALALCLFVVTARAEKKTWVFSLMTVNSSGVTVYDSGNTTAAHSTGVSNMVRRHGPIPNELKTDLYTIDIRDTNGYFQAAITDMDPSQAASGTSDFSSGTTSGLSVKAVMQNTSDAWAKAELIPVFLDVAINSATSPWLKYFQIDPANYMRVYFLPTGVTAYDISEIDITSGYGGEGWATRQPIIIGAEYLAINANSGVSALTVPDGARSVRLSFQGDTLRSRSDGTDPTSVEGDLWDEGNVWIINGGRTREAGTVKFTMSSGGSGATISAIYKN